MMAHALMMHGCGIGRSAERNQQSQSQKRTHRISLQQLICFNKAEANSPALPICVRTIPAPRGCGFTMFHIREMP